MSFDYRLYWQDSEPAFPEIHRQGGSHTAGPGRRYREPIPGRATSTNSWSISPAEPLMQMQQRFDVTPVVSASRGKIDNAYVIKVVGTDRWRALFDLQLDGTAAGGSAPVPEAGQQDAQRDLAVSIFPAADVY